MKISSSRSYQPQVHLVRKPSGIARRIPKNQLGIAGHVLKLLHSQIP
ncbi:MAG: hypothetical protein LBJ67_14795 [Planctomycetaceae bacterium]|nr:hypothetical protein [Planctomycetaceae bacterium]